MSSVKVRYSTEKEEEVDSNGNTSQCAYWTMNQNYNNKKTEKEVVFR